MTHIFAELLAGISEQKNSSKNTSSTEMEKLVSLREEEMAKSGSYMLGHRIIELRQQEGEIHSDLPAELLEDLFEFVFIEIKT